MRGHGLDAEHKVLCPNPAVNSKPRCLLRTGRGVRRLAAPDPRPLGGTCMYLPRFLYRLNLSVWCLCLGDIWIYIGVYHAIVCLSNNVLFGRVSGSDLACNVLYAGLEGCGYDLWLSVY